MTRTQPGVAIVFTGGTIASKKDAAFGGIVPSLSADEILSAVPGIHDMARLRTVEFGRYPGPHVTPKVMLELSELVRSLLDNDSIDGVVVTHGTDTLEETAFFLDCTIESPKPIVVVGAMRNSSEPDWDGPRNLRDAIHVASSTGFRHMGTLVCLSGLVNAASEVSKNDTSELSAFTSFNFGPVARITNGNLLKYRSPMHRSVYHVTNLPDFVPLVKVYAGMDHRILRACRALGLNGVVIEAFGVGNVPPELYSEIVELVRDGIPVVLVSRVPVGRLEHVYAYEGAGRHLYKAGVIFADYLNGQKALIKLMVMLGAGFDVERIRYEFEWSQREQELALTI